MSCDCYTGHQKQLLLSWQHKLATIWGNQPGYMPPRQQTDRTMVSHQTHTYYVQSPPNFTSRRFSLQSRYPCLPHRQPICGRGDTVCIQQTQAFQPRQAFFQHQRSVPNLSITSAASLPQPRPHVPDNNELRQRIPEDIASYKDYNNISRSVSIPNKLVQNSSLFFYIEGTPEHEYNNLDEECNDYELELNTRLESLCLSVTEHALNSDV